MFEITQRTSKTTTWWTSLQINKLAFGYTIKLGDMELAAPNKATVLAILDHFLGLTAMDFQSYSDYILANYKREKENGPIEGNPWEPRAGDIDSRGVLGAGGDLSQSPVYWSGGEGANSDALGSKDPGTQVPLHERSQQPTPAERHDSATPSERGDEKTASDTRSISDPNLDYWLRDTGETD